MEDMQQITPKKSKSILALIGMIFAVTFVSVVFLFISLVLVFVGNRMIGYQVGWYGTDIPVAGTGSMYPTFPKGKAQAAKERSDEIVANPEMIYYPNGFTFFGKRYFSYSLRRGDIVDFENQTTRKITQKTYGSPSGYVKRLIGLPGDTVEFRDGIVYIDNKAQTEPYTAKPRSTFGGEFLPDCTPKKVPEGKLFVMGDNRTGSGDSRHDLGFIDITDVDHVLPLEKQKGKWDSTWRDTQKDFLASSKMTINKQAYLENLNERRLKEGKKPLAYQPKLELSARKRGEIILKFNDFSFEATRSGYTMKKAMRDSGYSNIVYGESSLQGYYDADELMENYFEFPDWVDFLLEDDYQEVGLAEVQGEIDGCPTQIVVQHFAGFIPPNYSQELIESWKEALRRLKQIQPGWQSLKQEIGFYEKNKETIDKLNDIISLRISRMEQIVNRMETNQWLTDEEDRFQKEDDALMKEQNDLAIKLNSS